LGKFPARQGPLARLAPAQLEMIEIGRTRQAPGQIELGHRSRNSSIAQRFLSPHGEAGIVLQVGSSGTEPHLGWLNRWTALAHIAAAQEMALKRRLRRRG